MLKPLLAEQSVRVLEGSFTPPRIREVVGKERRHLRVPNGLVQRVQQGLLLHGEVEYGCIERVVFHLERSLRHLCIFEV